MRVSKGSNGQQQDFPTKLSVCYYGPKMVIGAAAACLVAQRKHTYAHGSRSCDLCALHQKEAALHYHRAFFEAKSHLAVSSVTESTQGMGWGGGS